MSSLTDLNPASWDRETYFKYIEQSRELRSSPGSATRSAKEAQSDRVRLVALNAAIKKYEKAAFQLLTQHTDTERG